MRVVVCPVSQSVFGFVCFESDNSGRVFPPSFLSVNRLSFLMFVILQVSRRQCAHHSKSWHIRQIGLPSNLVSGVCTCQFAIMFSFCWYTLITGGAAGVSCSAGYSVFKLCVDSGWQSSVAKFFRSDQAFVPRENQVYRGDSGHTDVERSTAYDALSEIPITTRCLMMRVAPLVGLGGGDRLLSRNSIGSIEVGAFEGLAELNML